MLTVSISSRLDEIPTVISKFETFGEQHRLPDRLRRSIKLVFDELLSNTISYAYPGGGDHSIDVKVELVADRLEITLSDDGIPFDPLTQSAPDTDLAIEDRDIGGLGIHLVLNVMDETRYTRRTDLNEITLVKYIEAG